jgi:hypothetical protein
MENTMATIDKLNFVTTHKPTHQPPVVKRRNKLSNKLWEQIQLAKSQLDGKPLAINKRKTVKDTEGNLKSITVPKRIKPWWFVSDDGKVCISVRYGSKIISLKPGMPSIQVNDPQELIETLEIIKTEVEKGGFDQEIEAASGALKANFKK